MQPETSSGARQAVSSRHKRTAAFRWVVSASGEALDELLERLVQIFLLPSWGIPGQSMSGCRPVGLPASKRTVPSGVQAYDVEYCFVRSGVADGTLAELFRAMTLAILEEDRSVLWSARITVPRPEARRLLLSRA